MSVLTDHRVCCPNCKSDQSIKVTFTGTCLLTDDGSEDDGDHEWGDESAASCTKCGHDGFVRDFRDAGKAQLEASETAYAKACGI
jgi:hypothetical protein